MAEDPIAEAIHANFTSPNISDSNGEMANIVDVLAMLPDALARCFFALHAASDGRTDINMVEALEDIANASRYAGDGLANIGEALGRIATVMEEKS